MSQGVAPEICLSYGNLDLLVGRVFSAGSTRPDELNSKRKYCRDTSWRGWFFRRQWTYFLLDGAH